MRHRPGWVETEGETDWDIFWAEKEWIHQTLDHVHLTDTQRVNHFRNHFELTRKDLLIKNLKRMKKQLEREERALEASKSAPPISLPLSPLPLPPTIFFQFHVALVLP